MAAAVTIPNTIIDGSANDAARPMANWNALATWINANAVHLDGTKAMTGTLSGPAGVDPVAADEYSRKAYVDAGNARVGAGASRAANQSIPNASFTSLSFDTQVWDSSTFFAPTSTTITVPAGLAGVYTISGIAAASAGAIVSLVQIVISGVPIADAFWTNSPASGGLTLATVNYTGVLSAGATVSLRVLQSSGGSQNYTGSLTVVRIAP